MPNSYPEWWNFQLAPNNHYRFFFLHTIPLKAKYVLFYQFYAKISTFSIKKCSVRLLSTTSWCHAPGHVIPPRIRWKYPERVKIIKTLVGYTRIILSQICAFSCWTQHHTVLFQDDMYQFQVTWNCLCLFQNFFTSSCPALVTTITRLFGLSQVNTPES